MTVLNPQNQASTELVKALSAEQILQLTMEQFKELTLSTNQARLRRNILAAFINQPSEAKKYVPHAFRDAEGNRVLKKRKDKLENYEIPTLLVQQFRFLFLFNLGVEYVVTAKGPEELAKLLEKAQVEAIVEYGRKTLQVCQKKQQELGTLQNHISNTKKDWKRKEHYYFSTTFEDQRKKCRLKDDIIHYAAVKGGHAYMSTSEVSTMAEQPLLPQVKQFLFAGNRAMQTFRLAEQLGIPPEQCSALAGENGLRYLLEGFEERNEVGLAEIAVFCALMAHRAQIPVEQYLTLPVEAQKLFFSEWRWNPQKQEFFLSEQTIQQYREACQHVYKQQHNEYWAFAEHYLSNVLACVNRKIEQGHLSPSDPKIHYHFPLNNTHRWTRKGGHFFLVPSEAEIRRGSELSTETQAGITAQRIPKTAAAKREATKRKMPGSLQEAQKFSKKKLTLIVKQNPQLQHWAHLVPKDADPEQVAGLLTRMFSTGYDLGKRISRELFFLYYLHQLNPFETQLSIKELVGLKLLRFNYCAYLPKEAPKAAKECFRRILKTFRRSILTSCRLSSDKSVMQVLEVSASHLHPKYKPHKHAIDVWHPLWNLPSAQTAGSSNAPACTAEAMEQWRQLLQEVDKAKTWQEADAAVTSTGGHFVQLSKAQRRVMFFRLQNQLGSEEMNKFLLASAMRASLFHRPLAELSELPISGPKAEQQAQVLLIDLPLTALKKKSIGSGNVVSRLHLPKETWPASRESFKNIEKQTLEEFKDFLLYQDDKTLSQVLGWRQDPSISICTLLTQETYQQADLPMLKWLLQTIPHTLQMLLLVGKILGAGNPDVQMQVLGWKELNIEAQARMLITCIQGVAKQTKNKQTKEDLQLPKHKREWVTEKEIPLVNLPEPFYHLNQPLNANWQLRMQTLNYLKAKKMSTPLQELASITTRAQRINAKVRASIEAATLKEKREEKAWEETKKTLRGQKGKKAKNGG